jgi:hypothetical protein
MYGHNLLQILKLPVVCVCELAGHFRNNRILYVRDLGKFQGNCCLDMAHVGHGDLNLGCLGSHGVPVIYGI